MIIAVAGPYSAPTAAERKANLDVLNLAAARLVSIGHTPLIGINAALPVLEKLLGDEHYKTAMDISMAVVNGCEALLLLAESPGANRERDLVLSKGLPVFYAIDEVPFNNNAH